MWLAINDLYTGIKAQVYILDQFSDHLSFDVSQGKGQGGILAPFMYKIYINSLPHFLFDHNYAIFIRSL